MWLLIDAGNTKLKWAVAAADDWADDGAVRWRQYGNLAHAEVAPLAQQWHGLPVERVVISNVAGETMRVVLQQQLVAALPQVPVTWFASSSACAGLRNAYREPQRLGCDRFASAIAAHALHPQQPVLMVTSGTATTIDAISADGMFEGGMIVPGLLLMAGALAKNTAQLPQIDPTRLDVPAFANNTQDAIVSGCLHAQCGAIRLAYDALRQTSGTELQCVLAGGAAPYLSPRLDIPHRCVDNTVLLGLLWIQINQPC